MSSRPDPPDARPLFRMLREHLRQAGTSTLILRDPEGGGYLAVAPDLESLASEVLRLANWSRIHRRAPDVMADTGEVVTDFKPIYPPDCR